MNKSSHFFVVVGLGLATATAAFAGRVDVVPTTAVISVAQRDFALGGTIKTGYDATVRVAADAGASKSPQAGVASVSATPLRDSDQQPLTGSLTLLAGLALIGGIAVKRLSN